jgi:hypothetical protein
LGEVLTNLLNFKNENEELHRIYDQECLALKFKKQQNSKLLTEYQNITKKLADAHRKLKIIHKEEDWRR